MYHNTSLNHIGCLDLYCSAFVMLGCASTELLLESPHPLSRGASSGTTSGVEVEGESCSPLSTGTLEHPRAESTGSIGGKSWSTRSSLTSGRAGLSDGPSGSPMGVLLETLMDHGPLLHSHQSEKPHVLLSDPEL